MMRLRKKMVALLLSVVLASGVWFPIRKSNAAESVLMISLPLNERTSVAEIVLDVEIVESAVHVIGKKVVMINWNTNIPSESHLLISRSKKQIKKYRGEAFSDEMIGEAHSITADLKPNKKYYAVIIADSEDGSSRDISRIITFRTSK